MSSGSEVKSKDLIKELFQAGAHFGYSRSRRHPSATPFIFGFKNRTAVIDLEKTKAQLAAAKDFITSVAAAGGQIVLVGTKAEARAATARVGRDLGQPYVARRWLGGTLTNFSQMKRRLARFAELNESKEKGGLARYTKREQAVLEKERLDLERYFGTITNLKDLPKALVVIDSREEDIAVNEANKLGIPVVSFSGVDCDLTKVSHPVVGNDSQAAAISLFLEEIGDAYRSGIIKGDDARNHESN